MKIFLAIYLFISSLFGISESLQIKGVVLPHHDLAKEIFHTSLEKLKKEITPSTIVIYGTNHYFPDGPTFITTKVAKDKYNFGDFVVDDEKIKKEHSIQTTTPYLNEYFPKANIVPIIISSQYDPKSVDDLVMYLKNTLPKDTLYVASVDFSHNSTVESGLLKNNESIEAIKSFDYQKVLDYHDDHMDSPVAIAVFMKTMEIFDAKAWETWISSHGGIITNTPNLNGTSYVVGIFK